MKPEILIIAKDRKAFDEAISIKVDAEWEKHSWGALSRKSDVMVLLLEEIDYAESFEGWKTWVFHYEVILYGTFQLSKNQYFRIARRCNRGPEFTNVFNELDLKERIKVLLENVPSELFEV